MIDSNNKKLPLRWFVAQNLWKEYIEAASQNKTQLDHWLKLKFKENKNFGGKDRFWYSEALFSFTRFAALACACEVLHKNKSSSLDSLSKLFQGDFLESLKKLDFQYLAHVVSLKNETLEPKLFLVEGLEEVICLFEVSQIKKRDFFHSLTSGFPVGALPFLEKRKLHSSWSEKDTFHFIKNHSKKPSTWIRINHPEKNFQKIQKEFSLKKAPLFKESALCENPKQLKNSEAFQKGFFEVQDLASQWIGHFYDNLSLKPKNETYTLWDACAGAGGKSLQFISEFKYPLQIYASDIRTQKLKIAHSRFRRNEQENKNIQFFEWDARLKRESPPIEFDFVFIDSPCTASGTYRRNPDQAFFLTPIFLEKILQLQAELLEAASKSVQKGGYFIYATCSFLVEENEDQVERFLKKNKQFELIEMGLFGSPEFDCDTMFRSVMKRL